MSSLVYQLVHSSVRVEIDVPLPARGQEVYGSPVKVYGQLRSSRRGGVVRLAPDRSLRWHEVPAVADGRTKEKERLGSSNLFFPNDAVTHVAVFGEPHGDIGEDVKVVQSVDSMTAGPGRAAQLTPPRLLTSSPVVTGEFMRRLLGEECVATATRSTNETA